jgi:hypothetical protein
MGRNMAYWKILEKMTIDLKKKGVIVPENIMSDLRSTKSMIKLSCTRGQAAGDALQKAEEMSSNLEAFLVNEAQKILGSRKVVEWLRLLEKTKIEACEEPKSENNFVSGVPRDKKWVRVEPVNALSTKRLSELAKDQNLQITPQKDGKLLVYGQQESLKEFIKKMTQESK